MKIAKVVHSTLEQVASALLLALPRSRHRASD